MYLHLSLKTKHYVFGKPEPNSCDFVTCLALLLSLCVTISPFYNHSFVTNANLPLGCYPQPKTIYLKSTSNLSVTVSFFITFLNNRRFPCDPNDPGPSPSNQLNITNLSFLPSNHQQPLFFQLNGNASGQFQSLFPLVLSGIAVFIKKMPTKQRLHQLIPTTTNLLSVQSVPYPPQRMISTSSSPAPPPN
jgi:hypothetical protein